MTESMKAMETGEVLADLHFEMLRIRLIEEEIADRYSDQEMRCPTHLSIGQEGVAVGVSAALEHRDYVFSNHRSHAHYLAKGGDARALVAELYGRVTGCTGGRGGSMHLVDVSEGFLGAVPIVSATIPVAVGAGLRIKTTEDDRVVVVYLGEGATEEGAFHESINFATLHALPIVFVCENNLYSVYSPMEVRQPGERDNVGLAKGYGAKAIRGDGNDVVEVMELTQKAVDAARKGAGPTFLEFETYRWREHCGPNFDNDLGYRTEQEFLEWKDRCPIKRLETRLKEEEVLDEDELRSQRSEIEEEIRNIFEYALNSPWPPQSMMREHIYSNPLNHRVRLPGD